MNQVSVDFSQTIGPIKPLHGVNNGPVTCNFWYDATPWFQKASIPFSRLHDTEYPFGGGEFVDIGCIFKDFDADVSDPASYSFTQTDDYLSCILKAGTQIIYRLGSSIEHQPVKVHIHPPKDYLKWAQICEHIILHYNEGWANGYHMNIEYWEIWNEPDLDLQPPRMWTGTWEEYFELYRVTSTHLKNKFPHLKIGGPALTKPQSPFAEAFFNYITSFDPPLPLDFYSWHDYSSTVDHTIQLTKEAEALLKRYGYDHTESICDEWNYIKDWSNMQESFDLMRRARGAALCAGLLCEMQHSPVDKAMYYDAQLVFDREFCGLFTPDIIHSHSIGNAVLPLKQYFSFLAFSKLYNLGTEAALTIDGDHLHGCAASNGSDKALMLVYYPEENEQDTSRTISFQWKEIDGQQMDTYLLDENRNLALVSASISPVREIKMEANSCLLFLIHDAKSNLGI